MLPQLMFLVSLAAPTPPLPALPAIVIVLEARVEPPVELRSRGTSLGGRSWRLPSTDPVTDARAWAVRPEVAAAEPDVLLPHRRHAFNDPEYASQWYLESLGMPALFAVTLGDPKTRVAVIDSGIDIGCQDLTLAVFSPYDALGHDDDPSPVPGDDCPSGQTGICDLHGTAVSGIVAARANNGVGIVGLCAACTLVPIRLISDTQTALSDDVRAFEHAIAADVAVINNSWGFSKHVPAPPTLAAVIHRAATETRGGKGALVIFAAGNDDRVLLDDEIEALDDVLCVSAVDSYGYPTAYTNRGATVDISAPSATVSLAPGDGITKTFGGTSAAAPVVAGLAAWAVSVDPSLTAKALRELLVTTALPSPLVTRDAKGHHDTYGYGIVDPGALLKTLVPAATAEVATEATPEPTPEAGAEPASAGATEPATIAEPPLVTTAAANGSAASGCGAAHQSQEGPLGLASTLLALLWAARTGLRRRSA